MPKLATNVFETTRVQTSDELLISVDFAARIASGEEIASVVVTIFNKAVTDVTSTILNGSAAVATGEATNSKITFNVHALVNDERYDARVVATTDATTAQKLEVDVFIPVNNVLNVVA